MGKGKRERQRRAERGALPPLGLGEPGSDEELAVENRAAHERMMRELGLTRVSTTTETLDGGSMTISRIIPG